MIDKVSLEPEYNVVLFVVIGAAEGPCTCCKRTDPCRTSGITRRARETSQSVSRHRNKPSKLFMSKIKSKGVGLKKSKLIIFSKERNKKINGPVDVSSFVIQIFIANDFYTFIEDLRQMSFHVIAY